MWCFAVGEEGCYRFICIKNKDVEVLELGSGSSLTVI